VDTVRSDASQIDAAQTNGDGGAEEEKTGAAQEAVEHYNFRLEREH
jgi:hypothetical protein